MNIHAVISSEARGLNLSMSLLLQPYFMYASSEGSDKSAQLYRLARAATPKAHVLAPWEAV